MILTTPRLVLRRFRDTDAASLFAYRSDPEVACYQSWSAPATVDDALHAVRVLAGGDPDGPGWFQYAVEHTGDRAHIGDLGVHLDDNLLQAEIGFTFASAYQGRGYATEAARAVLDRAFRVQGLHRVSAACDPRNERSARLLERAGFSREGLRPEYTLVRGEWTDDLLFGLLARDFPAS